MMKWVLRFTCVLLGISVIGCKVGPDYREPEIKLPGQFAEASTRPSARPAQLVAWWTTFDDAALNSLVRGALESNLDLRIAASRVREARAARGIVGAGLYPSANASTGYSRSRMSGNTAIGGLMGGGAAGGASGGAAAAGGIPFAFPGFEQDMWQAGFDASWEIDLFGGVRRSIEAAEADIAAAEEARRDVLVVLSAEVARNYIELRGLQSQLAIAEGNLGTQRQTLELTQTRFRAGLSGQLDVTRSEAQVASTEATLPLLQTAIKRSIHRLGVLLGREPNALADELAAAKPIPSGPPVVPPGLPAELLRRRPDIRRAERQLAAATARIGVATSDLYPKFSLTGSFGFQSDDFRKWFNYDSRTWSIGPSFGWSVFNAGRVRSNIRVQTERQAQTLEQYRQTILLALQDVEDALVAYENEQKRQRSLAAAVQANQRAVQLAQELYTKGLTDLLNVLDAQRSLFASQDALAQSQRAAAASLVALYKALGGGW